MEPRPALEDGAPAVPVEHARAEQEHRVIERGAAAFLDGVQFARNVGDLLDEELIYLQPVGGVTVREQMVDHVVHAEVRKS